MNKNLYQLGTLAMESLPKSSLMIGSDPSIRGLGRSLRGDGFEVIEASEYSEGVRSLMSCMPQVVIISEEVPEMWHPGEVDKLRERGEVPVLVMGSGEEDSLVAAINQGADGYLDHRASPREQIARVRSVIRRLEATRASRYYSLQYYRN